MKSVRIGKVYESRLDLVNDPYYLGSILLDDIKEKQKILRSIKSRRGSPASSIDNYAWWFFPLLKEILRWTGKSIPIYYIV